MSQSNMQTNIVLGLNEVVLHYTRIEVSQSVVETDQTTAVKH